MSKLPNLSLDTGDWLKDPKLSICSPATRGIWMDLLCRMHELDRCGEIVGTVDELAQLSRSSAAQFTEAARELRDRDAATIRFDGTRFFIRNRRMFAESQKRKSNAERQMRYRESQRNGEVSEFDACFERFWAAFPKGRKKAKGKAREAFRKAVTKADPETIIQAATEYGASEIGQGKFVKMPETWLNGECWSDDRESWRDIDNQANGEGFRKVTKEEFYKAVQDRAFKDGPRRATSDPCWVFGTLSDGSRIECRQYWPPKNQTNQGTNDESRA